MQIRIILRQLETMTMQMKITCKLRQEQMIKQMTYWLLFYAVDSIERFIVNKIFMGALTQPMLPL